MNQLSIKKTALTILFILILVSQFFVYKIWNSHNYLQDSIDKNINELLKPNHSLVLSNEATKNYLEAGNYFNKYIQDRDPLILKEYQKSLSRMSVYLDSLNYINKSNKDFSFVINNKKETEKEVIELKKQLDILINQKIEENKKNLNSTLIIKKFNYEKILSSISYDTVTKKTEAKKKSFLGRIGNALKGKSEVNKEEVQSIIKMVFNNQEKSGTFEDQLRNTFLLTEKYYIDNLNKIQYTYNTLKNKDYQLLEINKKIQDKSRKLIVDYSRSTQEYTRTNFKKTINIYSKENNKHKKNVLFLLILISIATVLLILYTIYAYINENKLAAAKEKAEKNLDIKNQLMGILSHEMRAPLNIIANSSQKLIVQNKDAVLKSDINALLFASNSLQNMVNQILVFLKNENSKLKLYQSQMNLQKEIKSVLDSLQTLAEAKNIKLIQKLNPNIDVYAWADHVKIHQLFYNLIINAIKFTDKGSITVKVDISTIKNQYRLDISITDTGLGIPKEDINNVFYEFYQSENHKAQIGNGAGLGLMLCKNIVELHNGKIAINSTLNIGTTISFHLMLDQVHVNQQTFEMKLKSKFKDKVIKAAIIDDDIIYLQIIENLLQNIGFEVYNFKRAAEINSFLDQNIIDIILTDIQIFDYSGIDLSKDIKALNNENNQRPIIAISGDTYYNQKNIKALGFDDILIKPINKEELYQKLYNLL